MQSYYIRGISFSKWLIQSDTLIQSNRYFFTTLNFKLTMTHREMRSRRREEEMRLVQRTKDLDKHCTIAIVNWTSIARVRVRHTHVCVYTVYSSQNCKMSNLLHGKKTLKSAFTIKSSSFFPSRPLFYTDMRFCNSDLSTQL